MASSFTTNYGIEKITTGEQSGTWGTTTNYNVDILDRIASYTAVALADASTATLTVRAASPTDGSDNVQNGMYRVIKFTGTLSQNCTVTIAPSTTTAFFMIQNATSGGYSVIMAQGSAAATVTVATTKAQIVYCDGSDEVVSVSDKLDGEPDGTASVKGIVIVAGTAPASVGYSAGTATVAVADSSASAKGAVIVAGTSPVSVGYSSGTATVALGTVPLAKGGTGATSLAAANIVATNAQNTFTKAQVPSTYTAALSATSGVLDYDTYQTFIITLAAGSNTLAAPTTEASQIGQSGVIIFIQPGSGAAATISLHADYETAEAAGLTISSANNDYDIVPYFIKADNSILLGAPQLNFG